MSIRKDCLNYHEEPYMGARVDCCLAETAFGMCLCTPDCKNYIPRDSSVRIVRCKDCIHRDPEDKKCDCGHDIIWQLPRDDNWFCADGAECEKCGREAVYQIVDDHWEYEPWCPHCGAIMDGNREE